VRVAARVVRIGSLGDVLERASFENHARLPALAHQPWQVNGGVDADGGECDAMVESAELVVAEFAVLEKSVRARPSEGRAQEYVWQHIAEPRPLWSMEFEHPVADSAIQVTLPAVYEVLFSTHEPWMDHRHFLKYIP
jgi:hypothetical protein